jgi:hypothetical protein
MSGIPSILQQLFSNPVNSKINLSGNIPTNYQAKRTFKATTGGTGLLPYIKQTATVSTTPVNESFTD